MAKKLWQMRIEEDDGRRVCIVTMKSGNTNKDVVVAPEIEQLLKELQREHDKYEQRDYRHGAHLEQVAIKQIPHSAYGKSPEDLLIERYESDLLYDALNSLPIVQRRRFILKYDYQLTTAEISRLEGCSSRAIERSLTNARRKLQKILQM